MKLARTEADVEERNTLIDLMSVALERLDNFVDSMFDYYRIKQGELQLSDINFEQLMEDQLHMHGVTIKVANIHFEYHVNHNTNNVFRSDALKLQVILTNLISNALKYQRRENPDKRVKLDIIVEDSMAKIIISDNGIGISELYKHQIFDIFYRATTNEYGSGVGLYNVKDAITKLSGTITVDSKENEGTVFTITIPGKI